MSLLNRLVSRIQRDFFRWWYQQEARKIADTQPLAPGRVPYILLSMVHTRDVVSYLVAVKSFASQINPERIVIVCDPTISAEDKAFMRKHIPHVELRDADEFVHPAIPRGGCWERLFAISALSQDGYVVQLDADTVTAAEVSEVRDAINAGQGFVLGEEPNQTLLTFAQSSCKALPKVTHSAHIQTAAEATLVAIGLAPDLLYVRGCAGFTGFPRSPAMRERLLDFSQRMSDQLGADRWSTWGTEQVTSNYLVANAEGTTVLPFPKYATPDVLSEESAFLHFIGSMRFVDSKYARVTKRIIQDLRRG